MTKAVVLFLLLIAASCAEADSWRKAEAMGAISADGRIVVRVAPGSSMGEVFGYNGEPKGEHAVANYYRLPAGSDKFFSFMRVRLENPIAPVFIAVANSGELVTLDNWHNLGIGKVVTIYSAKGAVVRSHALTDIYSLEEIGKFPSSVSSISWRCNLMPVLLEEKMPLLVFADALGNDVEVNVATAQISKKLVHKRC